MYFEHLLRSENWVVYFAYVIALYFHNQLARYVLKIFL